MRYWKVGFFLLLPLYIWADSDVVTPPFIDLLKEMHIHHDGSVPSIVKAMKAAGWERPLEKGSWEVADLGNEERGLVLSCAVKMGMMDVRKPAKNRYNYCIICGGYSSRMEKRIKFLLDLWGQGCRFDRLIFLTGVRGLKPDDPRNPEGCKTQIESTHKMWDAMEIPADLRSLPVTFIDAEPIFVHMGKRRPQMGDVLSNWLKSNPKPGSCLLISGQPYRGYHEAVVRTLLPASFSMEVVGPGTTPAEESAAGILDLFSRWIYQEQLQRR